MEPTCLAASSPFLDQMSAQVSLIGYHDALILTTLPLNCSQLVLGYINMGLSTCIKNGLTETDLYYSKFSVADFKCMLLLDIHNVGLKSDLYYLTYHMVDLKSHLLPDTTYAWP